jgi:LysR family transcriptional regulator, glycine cleavage system transcriptional activator
MHDPRTHPSVQSLLAFESAARLLSFQAAGLELGLTPSAISHRIKNFEALCGAPIFYRETRAIILTAHGREQLVKVKRILALLRELPGKIAARNELKICAPPLFFVAVILPGLEAFQQRYGQLHLHVMQTRHQIDQFDVAVHYGTLTRTGWVTHHLLAAHHIAVCAPWIAIDGASLNQVLYRHALIEFSYATGAWRGIVNDRVRHDPTRPAALTVGSMNEAVTASKGGLGVALVIEELVQEELRTGALIALSDIHLKRQDFYLSHQQGIDNLDLYKRFSEWLTLRCSGSAAVHAGNHGPRYEARSG